MKSNFPKINLLSQIPSTGRALFWMWNGPLDVDVLLEQLRDMYKHDARSVCVLPMPYKYCPDGYGPDGTINQMGVEYLSPEFLQRVRVVVDEAKRLGMNYCLYDEGGWPSGEACYQVTREYPELKASVIHLQPDGKWKKQKTEGVDRLNPKATERFINLTHDAYRNAVGEHFGRTILFTFTDEPEGGRVFPGKQVPWAKDVKVFSGLPGKQIPWTEGLGDDFEKKFGYRVEEHLDVFERSPDKRSRKDMRIRADFFDCWSQRFTDAYFKVIQKWCHEHGLLSGGHLNGEDSTMGSLKYGFGHILRVMRAMDVPGIDTIWRLIFPGQSNHHFPLYASTAAHQIGSPYSFTVSFGVYGNGLTFEQMKWITDYQYVRGINLMVIGCYPLSTQDHLMSGERPHFGPINPLWDYSQIFHRYVARLGYALSCGQPAVETALYLPIRDMWARGVRDEAVEGYEALVESLEKKQCVFDLIDDDALTDAETRIEEGVCRVGPMASYKRILFPPCAWLKDATATRLADFVRSGGYLLFLKRWPGVDGDNGERLREALGKQSGDRVQVASVDEIVSAISPLVRLSPPCPSIRATARRLGNGSIYFLWNEGERSFEGTARFQEAWPPNELDPHTGRILSLPETEIKGEEILLPLCLRPGESKLLVFGDYEAEQRFTLKNIKTLNLIEGWEASVLRKFEVGEHDFVIQTPSTLKWDKIDLGPWRERFGEDFSGEVAYRIFVPLAKEWRGCSFRLELGHVEYAARIFVNGVERGQVIWPPWEIDIPEMGDQEPLEVKIVVTNTLANVLTSDKVRSDWQNRNRIDPRWLSPYDARAASFERDSRGGGLFGPVRLKIFRQ